MFNLGLSIVNGITRAFNDEILHTKVFCSCLLLLFVSVFSIMIYDLLS